MSEPRLITTTQAEMDAFVAKTHADAEDHVQQTLNERDTEQAHRFQEHIAQQQAAFEAKRLISVRKYGLTSFGMQTDGVTAAHINRIHDTVFVEMQKQGVKNGLKRWAIDPYEPFDSEWNILMRYIALSAFRYALLAHRQDYLHGTDRAFTSPKLPETLRSWGAIKLFRKKKGRAKTAPTDIPLPARASCQM
ncbi:hypothetical protein EXIGLDRAFT_769586 [Exidia glandulosa HHB12029]|uniref:Uncharacterized protein n=1 Tax=Exidia glandulosa HHB12029 TaxID=1314781 RepID=A0A165HDN2_EXIGL|nr:hypothetical protein EXIGLDRAFT_769586 [Exidia glandulosa HHB12029]